MVGASVTHTDKTYKMAALTGSMQNIQTTAAKRMLSFAVATRMAKAGLAMGDEVRLKSALSVAAAILLAGLGACSHGDPNESATQPAASAGPQANPAAPPGPAPPAAGLALSPEESAKLGLAVTAAKPAQYLREIEGYGSVVGRDTIAQALTDVVTAQAAVRQSHAALKRIQVLAGTPGADSAAAADSAERQAVADDAALDLAEAKAAAVLGQDSPWAGGHGSELSRALAAGRIKIARISFPLGSFTAGGPAHLRVRRLDQPLRNSWRIPNVWAAPADGSMPGRSYFAVLEQSDVNEGERLLAWATDAAAHGTEAGVFIPATALVITEHAYWCYARRANGTYQRIPVDIERPQPGGYFIAAGIEPGDPVVTAGAGLLLARESGSAADADQ
jgi:hypothetical protein